MANLLENLKKDITPKGIVIVVWLMMAQNITELLFLMLIILLIIMIKLVIQTTPKNCRFFNVFNQKKSFNLIISAKRYHRSA